MRQNAATDFSNETYLSIVSQVFPLETRMSDKVTEYRDFFYINLFKFLLIALVTMHVRLME